MWDAGKAALRLALANARALLVLDGVASAWRAAAFDVAGPLCRVVVTTRSTRVAARLGLDLATISVGPLSDDEAVMLLASSAGVPVDQIPDSGALPSFLRSCSLPWPLEICDFEMYHMVSCFRSARERAPPAISFLPPPSCLGLILVQARGLRPSAGRCR